MKTEHSHIDIDTFAKHLAKELNSEETKSFESWIALSDKNADDFNSYKKVWEATASLKSKKDVDVDKAWLKLSTELFEEKKVNKGKTSSIFLKLSGIAASIAIISILTVKIFSSSDIKIENLSKTVATSTKEQKTFTLDDNTIISLNQNSSIQYSESYSKYNTREVFLKGEAFFEVTRNEEKPFIVKTVHGNITVLGTSFNVSEENNQLAVSVKTGKVKVTVADGHEVILNAGNRGLYSVLKKTLVKDNITDLNYISWKTKYLVFNDVALSEAIAAINKSYYCNIIMESPALNNCLVNAEFSNKPLETIIKVISTTFDLTVEKQENGQIILSGTHCE